MPACRKYQTRLANSKNDVHNRGGSADARTGRPKLNEQRKYLAPHETRLTDAVEKVLLGDRTNFF
jgi:hypothetical protein